MIRKYKDLKLAIIGLGYVGLPLALEFSKIKSVTGFDISHKRVKELKSGIDKNLEFNKRELTKSKKLYFTDRIERLKSANCFIITVPTPIDKLKKPDLKPLLKASKIVSKILKRRFDYLRVNCLPRMYWEVCVPVLEKYSNLNFNKDFFVVIVLKE